MLEEISDAAAKAKGALRGLSAGQLVKAIRLQLGMSQQILAKRANVPQPMISRIERGGREPNLTTLIKVFSALFCDLIVAPILSESIQTIRHRQAKKKAEKHAQYLKGTMSLEAQQPDSKFLQTLMKKEEDRLLQGSGTELWEE